MVANPIDGMGNDMKFGGAMFFTEYSMTAPELAVALEERGYDSVWAPEHSHIPASRKTPFPGGGDLPKQYADAMDPFVVLAAAGCATKTIKLGTGVLLVQQRDTIQTAKLVAPLTRSARAASCLASVAAGTRTRRRTTARCMPRGSNGCARASRP
jgi:Luciferase-like monooxygenase